MPFLMDALFFFMGLNALSEQDEVKLSDLKTQPPPDAERARLRGFLAEIAKKRVILVEKYLVHRPPDVIAVDSYLFI
jgi:hypothetical protein